MSHMKHQRHYRKENPNINKEYFKENLLQNSRARCSYERMLVKVPQSKDLTKQ
jgi:hypothetical protein